MLGSSLGGDAGRAARPGDLVLLAQARTRGDRGGQARVVRVIGRPDVARDAIEGLMLDRGLARAFDPALEREAREFAGRGVGEGAGPGGPARRDLRELATFTIDPLTARDFDDAISAERSDGGGVRVWVHIADVSAYVPEGSLVDIEARARGTSVYVPGAVEPMLPQALSNDACSLVPGHDRAAVTVELQLHGEQLRSAEFYRSTIRSDARLDYDWVDRVFAGLERAQDPWAGPLQVAREAAQALMQARAQRAGALTLDSPEPEFVFDAEGNVSEIAGRVQTESHRLIEHLMIAANEAVASRLEQRGAPCLYRVHERPQAESVQRLVDQLASLAVPTPPVPERMSGTEAGQLMGEISRLVEEHIRHTAARARSGEEGVAPSGGRQALTSLVLRALRQAYYSPRNIGHAGLGSDCYCHFTSPIRRYPDLVCHRALLASIGEDEQAPRSGDLQELGAWTSERERAAMKIERDADDVARCFALEQALYETGWEQVFTGEVVGLISAGAFVAFGAGPVDTDAPPGAGSIPPYEGMLPVRRLAAMRRGEQGREWWELNEQGTILHGVLADLRSVGATLRLGDPTAVRVRRVDPPRGRVDLAPVESSTLG
jgi:ribonuclease R